MANFRARVLVADGTTFPFRRNATNAYLEAVDVATRNARAEDVSFHTAFARCSLEVHTPLITAEVYGFRMHFDAGAQALVRRAFRDARATWSPQQRKRLNRKFVLWEPGQSAFAATALDDALAELIHDPISTWANFQLLDFTEIREGRGQEITRASLRLYRGLDGRKNPRRHKKSR